MANAVRDKRSDPFLREMHNMSKAMELKQDDGDLTWDQDLLNLFNRAVQERNLLRQNEGPAFDLSRHDKALNDRCAALGGGAALCAVQGGYLKVDHQPAAAPKSLVMALDASRVRSASHSLVSDLSKLGMDLEEKKAGGKGIKGDWHLINELSRAVLQRNLLLEQAGLSFDLREHDARLVNYGNQLGVVLVKDHMGRARVERAPEQAVEIPAAAPKSRAALVKPWEPGPKGGDFKSKVVQFHQMNARAIRDLSFADRAALGEEGLELEFPTTQFLTRAEVRSLNVGPSVYASFMARLRDCGLDFPAGPNGPCMEVDKAKFELFMQSPEKHHMMADMLSSLCLMGFNDPKTKSPSGYTVPEAVVEGLKCALLQRVRRGELDLKNPRDMIAFNKIVGLCAGAIR
jgi:hypothetical protein